MHSVPSISSSPAKQPRAGYPVGRTSVAQTARDLIRPFGRARDAELHLVKSDPIVLLDDTIS